MDHLVTKYKFHFQDVIGKGLREAGKVRRGEKTIAKEGTARFWTRSPCNHQYQTQMNHGEEKVMLINNAASKQTDSSYYVTFQAMKLVSDNDN